MMFGLLDGMLGEPIPYFLHSDWMVTIVLFLCISLVSFVFSYNIKHLQQQIKTFFLNRERNSLFDEVTVIDSRFSALLVVHTCLMLAFCIYYFLSQHTPLLFDKFSHIALLGGLTLGVFVFLIAKWILYAVVNWVFFQKDRNSRWFESFVNLVVWLGLLLLPVVLLIVYFHLASNLAFIFVVTLIILAKIALLWKCFSNFFGKIYGTLHLILYFCALEILPDIILWKGLEMMNNNLILNF